jgi:cytochrome c biogenesis protein CcmG/thiol:disulfide interchange protein DsbE
MRLRGGVIALAILAAALAFGLTHGGAPSGRAAPPLPSTAVSGRAVQLAGLRGRPVVIAFFASWCGPCRAEAPTINQAQRALKGRAELVAVDWSDSRSSALAFVHRFGWGFPVLFDPNGVAGYAYGIQGLPAAFVLDADGRIVQRLIGPQTLASLRRAVATAARD